MQSRVFRKVSAGAMLSALLLTGCGSDTSVDAENASGQGALREVTLGLFPSSTVGAIQLGIDQGFFEAEGIDLEMLLGQGSTAQLPSLSSGSLEFMMASPTTPLMATTQGLDLKIVAGYGQNREEIVEDSVAVLVGPDSDIQSAKDLEGKVVAINALGSIGDIGIREAIARDGGDPASVTFVQIGFNEVAAQLESGEIDAGMVGPPFMQQILADGGTVISDFIQEADLDGAELVMVSSAALTEDDPELVASFVQALDATLEYAEANQDEVRDLLPEVLDTSPEAAEKTEFLRWSAELDVPALEQFADLMAKYDLVDTRPDIEETVWVP